MCEGLIEWGGEPRKRMCVMTSAKQRWKEIEGERRLRLSLLREAHLDRVATGMPLGAVVADPAQLAHNFFCCSPPSFYIDSPFICKDCGAHEIWTAKQQKWWYERAKGPIDSRAVRCRPCRLLERARLDEARRVSQAGMALKIEIKKNDENRSRNHN